MFKSHNNKNLVRWLLATYFLLLIFASSLCGQESRRPETPEPEPPLTEQQKRLKAFEIVWQTVNESFYDRNFGGLDWYQIRKRYEPLAAAAKTDAQLYLLLQQMLNELHQSHFFVIPPDSIPRFISSPKSAKLRNDGNSVDEEAEEGDEENTELDLSALLDKGNPELTERLSTGIGIDLRVINRDMIITRVEPDSSAARAGLRPGFIIKKAGYTSLDDAIARLEGNPIWKDLLRSELPRIFLAAFINGQPDSRVRLLVVDERNRLKTVIVRRQRLAGEMSKAVGNLPPLYVEFESRLLSGGIGYIRFDAFVPNIMKKVCASIRAMHGAPALILDLRGNQGGLLGMVSGLTGLLETKIVAMGAMQTRKGQTPLYAFPQKGSYAGALAILVDGSTESAAEMFASGMQENGRAVIVGEQSAGNTLPSAILKLPTGALFQYGWANFKTITGRTLEGAGVNPDVIVKLQRSRLLSASDPQLTAALVKVRGQINPSRASRAPTIITVAEPPGAPKSAEESSKTKTAIDSPPPGAALPAPAKPPTETSAAIDEGEKQSIDNILRKYFDASGGEDALRKPNNRVSTGSVEVPLMGLKGTVEIYEAAPDKKSSIITIPGYGIIQRTWNGVQGWIQDPLQGYIDLGGSISARVSGEADVYSLLRLKQSDAKLRFMGKLNLAGRETFVLQATYPGQVRQLWYFDTESGLLLRKDNVYYEDYREVDGLKLPFKIRDESFSGFSAVMQIETIKHDQSIDSSKFSEYPSCFTNSK